MDDIGERILDVCLRLYDRDWLAACDGNVSCRDGDVVTITPAGKHKGFIEVEDLATVSLDNRILSGSPSSERMMHLEVYKTCPLARAVVHAHPPRAIAWSVAHPEASEVPSGCLSEVILAVGAIPIVPYARPGTADMGQVLTPFLPRHRVMILARHGALAWGESLDEAYNGMERLEHSVKILSYAKAMGALSELPAAELDYLRALRANGNGKTL